MSFKTLQLIVMLSRFSSNFSNFSNFSNNIANNIRFGSTPLVSHVSSRNNTNINGFRCWGVSTMIDLKYCDPLLISNREHICQWIGELCDKIGMKRYGPANIVKFGTGKHAGYTAVQLIETSNLTMHASDETREVFIDLFSCAPYNPQKVAEYSKTMFQAQSYDQHTVERGLPC